MKTFSLRALCIGLCVLLLFAFSVEALAAKDVMLVLDNSGSMRKNDPQFMARGAVAKFIEQLGDDTRAGVLIFDQAVKVPVPLTQIDDASKQKLIDSLKDINYRGQLTDSPAAIERAIYELKTNGRPDAEKVIVFITDGIVDTGNVEADVEKTKWLRDELAVDASDNGIKVFAIAFTEHADFFLIQSLAKKTNGEYYRAMTAGDLAGVFETVHAAINAPPPAPIAEAPAVVEQPAAPAEQPPAPPVEPPAPQPPEPSGVVVTPIPDEKIEPTLLAPDESTQDLLASLSEDELLALKDISEQTGIPIEQLAKELVDTPASAPGDTSGPAPIITRPDTGPTDEDVRAGAIILAVAVGVLLVLVVLVVWFVRRRRKTAQSPAIEASGAVAGDAGPIPEAFIKDINHYTDDPAIQLSEKPLMVGRVAGTDTQHLDYLVVNKGTVGRRHAIIKYKDYSFWIVDQGSVNGTYINGERLSGEQQLKHGDKIRFHKYEFEFSQPEMDDGFHTVFADPNAAEATIVASAETLAATAALDLIKGANRPEPDDDGGDLFDDAPAGNAPAEPRESPAAAFADADVFNITGKTEVAPANAGDETMEESSTVILDTPPDMSPPPDLGDNLDDTRTVMDDEDEPKSGDFDDDFEDEDEELGVEINLDTVGADDHPSLIFGDPSSRSEGDDFDAEASAFFEDITVGPTPDDETAMPPSLGDDLFDDERTDDQAALDAKLEQATAILEGRTAGTDDGGKFGVDTVALNNPPGAGDATDDTDDKFIETDSFDAPATIPPAIPGSDDDKASGDVTLEAFMSTSMFESGKVQLTNEDETVLPAHVPDKPRDSDDDSPIAGDTVVLPGSPRARREKAADDDADDSEDPTVLK